MTVPTIMDGRVGPWGARVRRTVGWRMKPLGSRKTMGRPSRRAFFALGPYVRRPLGHGDFVAFAAAAHRFLGTPLAAPQQAPDAGETRGNAKMAFNEGGHTLVGPECMAPAMGARPLTEQRPHLLALRCAECRLTPRLPLGAEARVPLVGQGIPLATDRARGGLHLTGHLADAPADVQQGHRRTTTNFPLLFGACRSHTTLSGTTSSFL